MQNTYSIVTWNVNSIKARLNNVLEFLNNEKPDIVLLQELKCVDENFPKMEIEDLGYNIATHGQKTYNGVAVLSKFPIDEYFTKLPNFEDEQARYIEAVITVENKAIRVASVYVPNGNQVGSEKFQYKMNFYAAMQNHFDNIKKFDEEIIIGGDFNCALEDIDVYDPKSLSGTICFHIDEKRNLRKIINNSYTDIYRNFNPNKQQFTWWDYRAGAWNYNKGMRIDYIFTNPLATDKAINSEVLSSYRGQEKASDHAPVMARFGV